MKEKIELNSNALWLRKQFGEDDFSRLDAFGFLSAIDNLTVVFYPMSNHISGMCIRAGNQILVAINSALSLGRQRFSAAHELYHLYFQKELRQVICGVEIGRGKDEEEKNADAFASFFLAPYDALRFFLQELLEKKGNRSIDLADVIRIEQHFGMSHQATLYRLQNEGFISGGNVEAFKSNVIRSAQKLGYDTSLYKKTPEDQQYKTTGNYIHLTGQLLERGIISQGKYEELLLEAYRSDIIDNVELEGDTVYD